MGSLLFENYTIQEWESLANKKLPKQSQNRTMSVLKLSYDHLPTNLKHCFVYCSLFPKRFRFDVLSLINLWISQGYIKPTHGRETIEQAGHSNFMYFLGRAFCEAMSNNKSGEIDSCKMHDLIHDLAIYVADEECSMLSSTATDASEYVRHVCMGDSIDNTCIIPTDLRNGKKLRSFLVMSGGSIPTSTLDQLCANFKSLRSLNLRRLEIENVPRCIGELKHLRCLVLSDNKFERLPDSMTKLVNLFSLDISNCCKLRGLPDNIRNLINLRSLNIGGCGQLMKMPAGIGELTCLQYLSDFKVGKAAREEDGVKRWSGLDALAGLMELRGQLEIEFQDGWDGDECSWQLPVSLQELTIKDYPGRRMPDWGMSVRTNNLASLDLVSCNRVKYLPPLRCLANLRMLSLCKLMELEFVEEERLVAGLPFFPRLEVLELVELPNLKGWCSKVKTDFTESPPPFGTFPFFLSLRQLMIRECTNLLAMPQCPRLQVLNVWSWCPAWNLECVDWDAIRDLRELSIAPS